MVDFIDFIKLFGGFVYLLVGGDLLVRGSLGLAREKNLSPVIVGMTIVAMGTSAPELMVSGYSALSGHPGIAVGNVVGSNIANVYSYGDTSSNISDIFCSTWPVKTDKSDGNNVLLINLNAHIRANNQIGRHMSSYHFGVFPSYDNAWCGRNAGSR